MITELELSLHNGEINLFDYLEEKKAELDLHIDILDDDDRPQAKRWNETSEFNKTKGLTPRMRAYCQKHGLDDILDLNIVWKKPRQNHIWRVRK